MKVFWAWQSDLHGKTNRHFIKSCLEEAIDQLNEAREISEPDEQFQGMELDHDRKDVSGSVDLAAEILKKIAAASVFVADVTSVGQGASRKTDEGEEPPKKLMNPNVAIELGYALNSLGTNRILMMMNTHYGSRSSVPFDLAHKNGPIIFNLPPNADKAVIEAERRKLVPWLCSELKLFQPRPELKVFPERQPASSRAFFAPETWAIGQYRIEHGAAFYLRVIPTKELLRPMAKDDLRNAVFHLGSFGRTQGGAVQANSEGAACVDPNSSSYIDSLSQVFGTGEVWGINTETLRNGTRESPALIFQVPIERRYIQELPVYLRFMSEHLKIDPPYMVEAGMVGVKGRVLMVFQDHTHGHGPYGEPFGDMYSDPPPYRKVIEKPTEAAINEFLLGYFQSIFDQVGKDRPEGLNGL